MKQVNGANAPWPTQYRSLDHVSEGERKPFESERKAKRQPDAPWLPKARYACRVRGISNPRIKGPRSANERGCQKTQNTNQTPQHAPIQKTIFD